MPHTHDSGGSGRSRRDREQIGKRRAAMRVAVERIRAELNKDVATEEPAGPKRRGSDEWMPLLQRQSEARTDTAEQPSGIGSEWPGSGWLDASESAAESATTQRPPV